MDSDQDGLLSVSTESEIFLREGFRLCLRCGEELAEDQFGISRWGTPFRVCRGCTKIKMGDPGDQRRLDSRKSVARRHGITVEQYDWLYERQEGLCLVCFVEPDNQLLYVDHDHACCPDIGSCGNCIRGLLCSHCNGLLGYARDRIDVLESAVEYLRMGFQEIPTIEKPEILCEDCGEGTGSTHLLTRRCSLCKLEFERVRARELAEAVRRAAGVYPKGEEPTCKKGHPFDEGNTLYEHNPDGTTNRRCRECRRGYAAAKWAEAKGDRPNLPNHPVDSARSRLLTIFGETQRVLEWSNDERCVVPPKIFKNRVERGWDFERALTEPSNLTRSRLGPSVSGHIIEILKSGPLDRAGILKGIAKTNWESTSKDVPQSISSTIGYLVRTGRVAADKSERHTIYSLAPEGTLPIPDPSRRPSRGA